MKNRLINLLFLALILVVFVNCGNSNAEEKKGLSNEEKWSATSEQVKVTSLPSITFEEMKGLYEGCDFIDVIFYDVEFSMSVNNKNNIQRMVGFVSTEVAQLNSTCKAMGRLFFQKNGEVVAEADMYFDEKCNYFVFQKNGKAAYANYITPQGQAYFAKIFSQVKVEQIPQ